MANVKPYANNVVVDASGNLYFFVNGASNLMLVKNFHGTMITQVYKNQFINPSWFSSTFFFSFGLTPSAFIGMDLRGNVIIPWSTAWGAGAIWKISSSGVLTTTPTLGAPIAVTVDASNNIYFTQWVYNNGAWFGPIVQVLNDQTQVISTVFGSSTTSYTSTSCVVGPATSTTLNYAEQIVTDRLGNLYVVNQGCYNVVMWNKNTLTTKVFAGTTGVSSGSPGDGGQATSAIFNMPYGLAIDKNSENMYISDYGRNNVRRVNFRTGIISTFAGVSGLAGTTGDYGPATGALLNQPLGLAMDPAGRQNPPSLLFPV